MTSRKGKKRSQIRKAPDLDLTDRMRDQGVQATTWYTGTTCGQCGGPVATNGTTTWCGKGEHE